MSLFRAELMKLWTVRTPRVLLAIAAIVAVIAAAIQIGVIEYRDGDPTLSSGQVAGLLAGAATAVPLALFMGAIGATSEMRHGTEYLNHLISPSRWPFIAARLGAYLLFGLAFASALLGALLVTVLTWAFIRVGEVPWGSSPTRILLGVALATSAYTAIGLAIGSIFRDQIFAVSALASWVFVLEGFLWVPLLLIDIRLTSFLPVLAIQALLVDDAADGFLVGTGFESLSYGVWPTAAGIAAWTVGLSAIGIWRSLTTDIP